MQGRWTNGICMCDGGGGATVWACAAGDTAGDLFRTQRWTSGTIKTFSGAVPSDLHFIWPPFVFPNSTMTRNTRPVCVRPERRSAASGDRIETHVWWFRKSWTAETTSWSPLFLLTTLFHMCYPTVLMSSVLICNVEKLYKQRKSRVISWMFVPTRYCTMYIVIGFSWQTREIPLVQNFDHTLEKCEWNTIDHI